MGWVSFIIAPLNRILSLLRTNKRPREHENFAKKIRPISSPYAARKLRSFNSTRIISTDLFYFIFFLLCTKLLSEVDFRRLAIWPFFKFTRYKILRASRRGVSGLMDFRELCVRYFWSYRFPWAVTSTLVRKFTLLVYLKSYICRSIVPQILE